MKYLNAAELLPEHLLKEIQTYVDGEILYIPKISSKKNGVPLMVPGYFIKRGTRRSEDFSNRDFP